MDDLISRRAAINEIEYELDMINSALDSITLDFNARERLRQRKGEAREILNSIQQLHSATQWIPCSERLPEDENDVIVTVWGDSVMIAWWDNNQWRTEAFSLDNEEVDAWMPLPKPWREK